MSPLPSPGPQQAAQSGPPSSDAGPAGGAQPGPPSGADVSATGVAPSSGPAVNTAAQALGQGGSAPQPGIGGKKGLGMWGTAGSQGAKVGASWYYNWKAAPSMGDSGSLEYVPMIWDGSRINDQVIAQLKSSGYKQLLGFNEPDHADQSNMSVAEALKIWPQLMATGLRLGSPAPAGAPNWLSEFMPQAMQLGYRVDFLAVHYYPNAQDEAAVAKMREWLEGLHSQFGLPIWVTEFGMCEFATPGTLPPAALQTFVTQTVAMLESLPYVERYAWFSDKTYGGCSQSAILGGGGLTATGKAYAGAAH